MIDKNRVVSLFTGKLAEDPLIVPDVTYSGFPHERTGIKEREEIILGKYLGLSVLNRLVRPEVAISSNLSERKPVHHSYRILLSSIFANGSEFAPFIPRIIVRLVREWANRILMVLEVNDAEIEFGKSIQNMAEESAPEHTLKKKANWAKFEHLQAWWTENLEGSPLDKVMPRKQGVIDSGWFTDRQSKASGSPARKKTQAYADTLLIV